MDDRTPTRPRALSQVLSVNYGPDIIVVTTNTYKDGDAASRVKKQADFEIAQASGFPEPIFICKASRNDAAVTIETQIVGSRLINLYKKSRPNPRPGLP